jgi:hypothetical protein
LQHIRDLKYSWSAKRKNLPRAQTTIDVVGAQFLPFFFVGAAAAGAGGVVVVWEGMEEGGVAVDVLGGALAAGAMMVKLLS